MSHPTAGAASPVRELERVEWVEGQVPLPGLPADVERDRLVAAGVSPAIAAVLAAGPPPAPPVDRSLAREHGSERGYRQHQAHDENTCKPCRTAHARYNDEHVDRWPS